MIDGEVHYKAATAHGTDSSAEGQAGAGAALHDDDDGIESGGNDEVDASMEVSGRDAWVLQFRDGSLARGRRRGSSACRVCALACMCTARCTNRTSWECSETFPCYRWSAFTTC